MNMKLKKIDACDPNAPCQLDLKAKNEKSKRLKPKDVFDYKKEEPSDRKKVPKGSHRMPDGSIMKDKDMKPKGNKQSNKKKKKSNY
jgi:hypothetical protein